MDTAHKNYVFLGKIYVKQFISVWEIAMSSSYCWKINKVKLRLYYTLVFIPNLFLNISQTSLLFNEGCISWNV